jgi:hypothetical protein
MLGSFRLGEYIFCVHNNNNKKREFNLQKKKKKFIVGVGWGQIFARSKKKIIKVNATKVT